MSNMSPASPSTIEGAAAYIAAIEKAFNSGDLQKVSTLIEHDFVTAWFGLLPSRLVEMIRAIEDSIADTPPFIQLVSYFLSAPIPQESPDSELRKAMANAKAQDYPYDRLIPYGLTLGLRLRGRPVEALEVANTVTKHDLVTPLFDTTMGWDLFITVQHGVTAMFAGDFHLAISCFTSARVHAAIPSLGFFVRDACAKSALIEALYGDPNQARSLLAELDHTPRTASWVEDGTHALRTVVEALLTTSDSAEAMRLLDSVNPAAVGEMWPFYITSVHRITMRQGDNDSNLSRLHRYELVPFPHVDGQGIPGSVLHLWRTYNCLANGNIEEARTHLARADQTTLAVQMPCALFELLRGRPREALEITSKIRKETSTFRLLEMARLGIVAGAHLELGSLDACMAAVKSALNARGGLQPYEAVWFPTAVQELAQRKFDNWPKLARDPIGYKAFPSYRERLTDRELEILRDLAKGLTREEIAKADFVSINTVKGHLRGLYRKLGVTSRNAAVIEGERRGLL